MRFASKAFRRSWPRLKTAADAGNIALTQENTRLRSITDELSHRIKNLVTIIQSIARQTMHETTTRHDFEARFSGRLGALGRSLDLLMTNNWCGARIDELVRLELTPFGALEGAQISVKGPPLALNPEAARSIGLALHELATNACKYGALSVPEGKVAVHWELPKSGGPRRFVMTWRESDGPMVTEPTHCGFGRQVIQQVTTQALGGDVTHEFLPEGVTWTLDIPAALIVNRRDLPTRALIDVESSRSGRDWHVGQ
jgi:two-component sensor histidine kinase